MSSEKYIGLDVHQATISVAVVDSQGKVVMESILETKASTLLEFFAGLRGSLFVTFEEGTWAAWLYDLLKPHVTEVLVCNPRKIPLLKQGNSHGRKIMKNQSSKQLLNDVRARQRNTVWPDTLRNGLSVDGLLWKGCHNATTVQRVGIAIFGLAFLTAGLTFAYTAYSQRSAIIAILSVPFILLEV